METYEYQQKLIESSMDGILGCNPDERVVTFNRSLEQISGYARGDVIGILPFSGLFEPDSAAAFHKALEGASHGGSGRLFYMKPAFLAKNGATVPIQLSATQIEEENKIEGLVCFIRDLRQLRRLEQEMADQAVFCTRIK